MKQYKSNKELLDYLISKNVIINDKEDALEKIERYSYYAIINTYKEIFKEDNTYIKNVTFDEIYALYEFDKNIKSIFIKYALEIEVVLKAILANRLAEQYGIDNYLKLENFDISSNKQNIEILLEQINKEVDSNYGKHIAITHYKDKYNFIPPFVLVKVMTMGEISRLYGLLKQNDRQYISKYFKISDKLLKQILINLTLARNICAHSDRLYTFHSRFFISYKVIDNNYKMKDCSTNLYMLINCMEKLLDKKKYKEFRKLLRKELNILDKNINSISINNVLNIMGFPNE